MENKGWEDVYKRIYELLSKIESKNKVDIDNQETRIKGLIKMLNDHKSNLIEYLGNKGVEATEEDSLGELIEKINIIEQGGEVPEYNIFDSITKYSGGQVFWEEKNLMGNSLGRHQLCDMAGGGLEGDMPVFNNLVSVEKDIGPSIGFSGAKFTGKFPYLPKIKYICSRGFNGSNFTGEFPYMETLEKIEEYAFDQSNFDKDENGFVKNYPGWNGKDEWNKPASYRAEMANETPPKLMTIFAPGGEMEVYDDIQGERARKYLEENEPSDIDYYLEYTKKLREIGFKRDEFGNYVDVVNDKSVIIIPEDIKFMV